MSLRSKIKHYIISIFLIIVILFLGVLDFPYLQKLYQDKAASKITNSVNDYLTAANSVLEFKKFLPLLVLNNSKILWYSVVPATEAFQACKIHEEPKINFFVSEESPIFNPIISIDVVDGLKCEKSKCYYKTIRLVAAQNECSNAIDNGDIKNFLNCSAKNETIYQQGYYYPIYSKIKVHYIISCCAKGFCEQKKSFVLKKF